MIAKLEKMKEWFRSLSDGKQPEGPFIWARVNPKRPHISFVELADAPADDWLAAIRIEGVTPEHIEHHQLLGRVIDWDKFSDADQIAIKRRELSVPLKKIMRLVRK